MRIFGMGLLACVFYSKASFFQKTTYFKQKKIREETWHFSDMTVIILNPFFSITFLEYSIGT